MASLIAAFGASVVVGVVGAVASLWVRRRRPRSPERTVWCVECGRALPVSRAVVVAEVPDDAEERELRGGGTVCIVEYCPEHAP